MGQQTWIPQGPRHPGESRRSTCIGWPVMLGGLRVGTDLVPVSVVADSIARFGDRYMRRIFTDHEIETCSGEPGVVASRLAARFAAKEAMIKVLCPTDDRPDWRSIEVQRDEFGRCTINLQGKAAHLARRAGIERLAVSLCHEGPTAVAVVIASD